MQESCSFGIECGGVANTVMILSLRRMEPLCFSCFKVPLGQTESEDVTLVSKLRVPGPSDNGYSSAAT